MTRNNETSETIYRVIEVLHAEGHEELANEFEELFDEYLSRYKRVLGWVKTTLYATVFIGGTLVTIGGVITLALRGEPLGAMMVLGLGLVILIVATAFHILITAFGESIGDEFKAQRKNILRNEHSRR